MALRSYLPERAGGEVAAAAFETRETAVAAARALRALGLRQQDVTAVAREVGEAAAVAAAAEVYAPQRRPPAMLFGPRLPRDVRRRFARPLADGAIVLVAAAGLQPVETLAAVLEGAGGAAVSRWWQEPTDIFPPPELAGPL